MEMINKITTEKYRFKFDNRREASVCFSKQIDGKWHYNQYGCKYTVFHKGSHDIDDWRFLNELSTEILRLEEEYKTR